VALATIAREWGRIGCVGFGGPPAHIALLRRLCVDDRGWLSEREFEDGIAACNLLPGPASTQLAILCAWRLRGPGGAVLGGLCFIVPGLVVILSLSAVFLAARPPGWIEGAGAGAGAVVPAVAVAAAVALLPGSWRRSGPHRTARIRWCGYLLAGGLAAATVGPWLVLVLAACGLIEVAAGLRPPTGGALAALPWGALPWGTLPSGALAPAAALPAAGGLVALAWVAFKVGVLSYGGGFVIIPLMQHDAVVAYRWMTDSQFLGAVALGQLTPGPVVLTVAVVGYAAAGMPGAALAAALSFAPSFGFVLLGAPRFRQLRRNTTIHAFLAGAGPAAIGAIAGAAIPLGLALNHLWQAGVLALASVWLLPARRSVVSGLAGAAVLGAVGALAGLPISR